VLQAVVGQKITRGLHHESPARYRAGRRLTAVSELIHCGSPICTLSSHAAGGDVAQARGYRTGPSKRSSR
jgi:hypothetical protein